MKSEFGSVDQLKSGRWRARVRIGGKRRSLGTFETEDESWLVVNEALRSTQLGHVELGGEDTLRVHGAKVLDARERDGVRDVSTERNRWRNHVETWPLIDAPMGTIRRGDICDWFSGVSAKTSRSTAKKVLSIVRAVLDDAVARDMLQVNPARGVKMPGRPGRIDDPWTYLDIDEQRALLRSDVFTIDDRILIAIALGTGLRAGEQFSVRIDDVFVSEGETTPRMVVRRSGKGATKSGKPRTIHLFGLGLAAVRAWLDRLPSYAPKNPKRLLCPLPSGAPRQPGDPLGRGQYCVGGRDRRMSRWLRLLDQAGLRRVRWHDLRHTFATSCVAGWFGHEWSLEQVCEYLGHSTITITERYAHLRAGASRTAAVTHAAGHENGCINLDGVGIGLFLAESCEASEPAPGGTNIQGTTDKIRTLRPNRDPIVTLAAEYLAAVACGAPRHVAIGVRMADAIMEQAESQTQLKTQRKR